MTMFAPDNNIRNLEENAKIWRYMGYSKFLSLLDKSALFFARADKLGDPYEGSYSKANVKIRPITYQQWPQEDIVAVSKFYELFPKFTIVNCWHRNEHDSAAMWKLYLQSNDGVAVQSTISRLTASFKEYNIHNIYIGEVEYIDFENELMRHEGNYYAFLFKRKSFEHEKEIRAIIQGIPRKTRGKEKGSYNFDKPLYEEGMNVDVDVDMLIDNIYLPPTCQKWQIELIQSLVNRFELNKKVLRSSLYDKENIVY